MNLPCRYPVAAAMLSIIVLSLGAFPALADEPAWQPPPPTPKADDWIRLTSGEWLRGEIEVMRNEVLEFDSEELDDLAIDWGDIAEIRSPRVMTYVFDYDPELSLTGTMTMTGDTIRIRAGNEIQTHPRPLLLSIIEGAGSELDRWSGKLSMGLVARSGNTDQTDLNSIMFIRREAEKTRLDFNYTGNIGELDGVQNINNHQGSAKLDVYISRNLFLTPASFDVYSDEFQNIDIRLTFGAGVGANLIRRKGLEWYLQLGAGYLSTQFVSVEAGQPDREESATVIPVTNFEWDITSDIEFDLNYNVTISVPETKNTFHHLVSLFTIEIIGILDFSVGLTWDRNENPQPTAEGAVPERDDFRLSAGLAINV